VHLVYIHPIDLTNNLLATKISLTLFMHAYIQSFTDYTKG